jgi:hypothetical protein
VARRDAPQGVRLQFSTSEFAPAELPHSVRQRWMEHRRGHQEVGRRRPRAARAPRPGCCTPRFSPESAAAQDEAGAQAAAELARLQVSRLPGAGPRRRATG